MRKITKGFVYIIFLLAISVLANAQNSWIGSYEFEEYGGKTVGGSGISIVHQMDILESDDSLIVMIRSNGFQTSEDLIAKAKSEGDKLRVYFDSYGEDNMFENYKKGDLLFTLERKNVGKGSPKILTFWDKYQPAVPKNEKSGVVYFQKVKAND